MGKGTWRDRLSNLPQVSKPGGQDSSPLGSVYSVTQHIHGLNLPSKTSHVCAYKFCNRMCLFFYCALKKMHLYVSLFKEEDREN